MRSFFLVLISAIGQPILPAAEPSISALPAVEVIVAENAVTTFPITITNAANNSARLVRIIPACRTCTRVALEEQLLGPHQSTSVEVELDANLRTTDFTTSVQPIFRIGEQEVAAPPIVIKAHVQTWLQMQPSLHGVVYGDAGKTIFVEHHLSLDGKTVDEKARHLEAHLIEGAHDVVMKLDPLAGKEGEWILSWNATYPTPGARVIAIEITSGVKRRTLRWLACVSHPWFADFTIAGGAGNPGSPIKKNIRIAENAPIDLKIRSVVADSGDVVVDEYIQTGSANHRELQITFHASSLGHHQTNLTVDCHTSVADAQVAFPLSVFIALPINSP